HRREALECQALSDGRDTRLRQWHVHHALGAEALLEALGRFEDATLAADVLAEHADPIVTLHFFVERVAHGLDQRALRHRRTRAGPASPGPARVRAPPPRSRSPLRDYHGLGSVVMPVVDARLWYSRRSS